MDNTPNTPQLAYATPANNAEPPELSLEAPMLATEAFADFVRTLKITEVNKQQRELSADEETFQYIAQALMLTINKNGAPDEANETNKDTATQN